MTTTASEEPPLGTQNLNEILIECALRRRCYPLMHRTLHEFNWFARCCIWGWSDYDQYEMDEHVRQYPDSWAAMVDQREQVRRIRNRWGDAYYYGDYELIRLARAFLVYCQEEYGSEEVEG